MFAWFVLEIWSDLPNENAINKNKDDAYTFTR